jgi:soluble lytic murein transglycosylase-like protein
MPANVRKFGVKDAFNPKENIAAGNALLAEEQERFGDVKLAAYAFNAGSPRVMNAIRRAGTNDPDRVAKYLPASTRQYGDKVLALVQQYGGGA